MYQTGNDALDLVLTEKSLLCNEYNIKMSSMVDGTLLKFISSTDVYALFGNLMDNVIESVMKETDEEKRIISIQVTRRKQGSFIYKGDARLQKCYTVDFLSKKRKANEGEVPQYYVEGSHDAIIEPAKWQLVQTEMQRRKNTGRSHNCCSPFSAS